MATRIVTISHATGAVGDSIGRSVADRLGFRYVDEAIRETARQGNVVIVSHAAGIPLAGRDDLRPVLVTASFATRVGRVVI